MTALPLRTESPLRLPAAVTVECCECDGSGERALIVNLRFQQDERVIGCPDCAGGKVTYRVGQVDDEIYGYDERTGRIVLFADVAAMEAGAITDSWPAAPWTVSDEEILEACGVVL